MSPRTSVLSDDDLFHHAERHAVLDETSAQGATVSDAAAMQIVPHGIRGSSAETLVLAAHPDAMGAPMTSAELCRAADESLAQVREQVLTTFHLVHTMQTTLGDLRREIARMRSTTTALSRESVALGAQARASQQAWAAETPFDTYPASAPGQSLLRGDDRDTVIP